MNTATQKHIELPIESAAKRPSSPAAMERSGIAVRVQRLVGRAFISHCVFPSAKLLDL